MSPLLLEELLEAGRLLEGGEARRMKLPLAAAAREIAPPLRRSDRGGRADDAPDEEGTQSRSSVLAFDHAPGRLSLPPGGAGLRERLTALAARSCALGAWSYVMYCPARRALGSLASVVPGT